MSILLVKPGILTTVQDTGRNGFRRFGINQNGAMDRAAARLINSLLGNDETAPVLEMHFPAPEILFEEPVRFALGGADFAAELDGAKLDNWKIFRAEKNSVLKFARKSFGSRAYLAVKGGLRVGRWLGSASTNLKAKIGGFEGRKLQTGDRIHFESDVPDGEPKFGRRVSNSLIPFYAGFPRVRVVAGAEFELLTAESRRVFTYENFTITPDSDRMGFRLAGTALSLLENNPMLSSAVSYGTIQLLPGGQMIVLMADHQTTGGYPRIANVATVDLPLLAQLGGLDKVSFHRISSAEAESLSLKFERDLNFLKIAAAFP
ncbi:MAG TPA: biotin-dependent carboxyltransferase family protein [Pyrinomonadaceae bacterium]|jgi:antagonist of KipI